MADAGAVAAAVRAIAEDSAQAGTDIGAALGTNIDDAAQNVLDGLTTSQAAEDANTQLIKDIKPNAGDVDAAGGAGGDAAGSGASGEPNRIARLLSGEDGDAGGEGEPASAGSPGGRSLPDWLKKKFDEGNQFNRDNQSRYPHNEVTLESGKRIDSYIPGREIVERKYSQLSQVKEETAKGYIDSLRSKYKVGEVIGDTPKNRAEGIAGQPLRGDHILEVPPQNEPVPPAILRHAEAHNVTIRDTNGTEY
jgi:hypothetical protein